MSITKNIAILGSTGSIGTNAIRVIESLGPKYSIHAITGHKNAKLLIEQAKKLRPKFVGITSQNQYSLVKDQLEPLGINVLTGDCLPEIASLDTVDTVITAVVGAVGLKAVLAAAERGKRLAIANKEPLVIAGELLMKTADKSGATVLPVDSEHSAIFQCLQSSPPDQVRKLILTSSGGPFRNATPESLADVTVDDALAHPVWDMGPKITIDSATMMNKALEVIEAHFLFNMPVEQINVLIHPQSVIHSMVEFIDGSVIAQLGTPDMCLPIQYALTYPYREEGISKHLDLATLGQLSFQPPDFDLFPALKLAFQVAKDGGSAPVVFNAANEAAVTQFLANKIKFVNIIGLIEKCLDKHDHKTHLTLEELLEVDAWARKEVDKCLNKKSQ